MLLLLATRGVSALAVRVQLSLPPLCPGLITADPSDFISPLWAERVRGSTTDWEGSCDISVRGVGLPSLIGLLLLQPMGRCSDLTNAQR